MSSQCRKDMYYDKCVYNQCKNGKFSHGKRLFRFPMQNTRCDIWIRNAGMYISVQSLCHYFFDMLKKRYFNITDKIYISIDI